MKVVFARMRFAGFLAEKLNRINIKINGNDGLASLYRDYVKKFGEIPEVGSAEDFATETARTTNAFKSLKAVLDNFPK